MCAIIFKLETFENASHRAKNIFDDETKKVGDILTKKTSTLHIHFGELANRMNNPTDCETLFNDVESCSPLFDFLERKNLQMLGLSKVFYQNTFFFENLKKKCSKVKNMKRCHELHVSMLIFISDTLTFKSFLLPGK